MRHDNTVAILSQFGARVPVTAQTTMVLICAAADSVWMATSTHRYAIDMRASLLLGIYVPGSFLMALSGADDDLLSWTVSLNSACSKGKLRGGAKCDGWWILHNDTRVHGEELVDACHDL